MTEPSVPLVEQTETIEASSPGAEIVQFRSRNSLNSKVHYAEKLAQSGLLPAAYKKQPANVLYAVEYGEMLGLAPMAAITGIHIIEGKPSASAALIGALVRRAGHRLRVTGNDTKATAQIIRKDDPDFVFESIWTIERAKQAGLTGKAVWKQYPAAMLKARAISEAARDACEEALSGVHYTPEELGENVGEDGIPTTLVEQMPAPEVDWDAEIAKCNGDRAELVQVWKRAPANVRAKIEAAAKAAKPVDVPVVVDAELVEEPAPTRKPPYQRPSKAEKGRTASEVFDQLLATADFDEAERLIREAPSVDVSSWINQKPDVQEVLGIFSGDKIMLSHFGQLVADYINVHGYSVQAALDGELPSEGSAA
jgi:hypothetical protein